MRRQDTIRSANDSRGLQKHLRLVVVALLLIANATIAVAGEPVVNSRPPSPRENGALPDTVVVCPEGFREALAPWLLHRRQQGHNITVIPPRPDKDALRNDIRGIAAAGSLKTIVLIGDTATPYDGRQQRHLPTHHAEAKVNVHFGSTDTIATDNWFADLDDDDLPDVAIGRLPADAAADLTAMVKKIITYETSTDFSPWRRKVNVVAGVGGFGVLADSLVESSTKWFLTASVPSAYRVSMTYGNWRSPYCPLPETFAAQTRERLNEGSLFWVYIGHGMPRFLDTIRVPGGQYPILSTRDVSQIDCQHGSPIAVFLSCYAGAYDLAEDCLGEELLRKPGGPVAVLASSRVALPYGLGVLSSELLSECFVRRRETLGEMLLEAKRQSMSDGAGDVRRRMLDTMSKAISPVEATPADERREHLHLVNLLGDPLLRLRQPQPVELETPKRTIAGEEVEIAFDAPLAGKATVELVVRRDRLRVRPQPRYKYEVSPAAMAQFAETYRAANDPSYLTRKIDVQPGRTTLSLPVPPEASGVCHIQVYLEGADGHAMGSSNISIRRPVQESPVQESPAKVSSAAVSAAGVGKGRSLKAASTSQASATSR